MKYAGDIALTESAVWAPTGFMVKRLPPQDGYGHCCMEFSSLNPEVQFRRVFSRWELMRVGAWLLWQAVR